MNLNEEIIRKIKLLLKAANRKCANGEVPKLKELKWFMLGVTYTLNGYALRSNYDSENNEYFVEVYKVVGDSIQYVIKP